MLNPMNQTIEVNGRHYRLPSARTAIVCLSGGSPDYLEAAVADGAAPFMARMMRDGAALGADGVIPSLTHANQLSIACGAPPALHGICGNTIHDAGAQQGHGADIALNQAADLRADTVLAAAARAGARVAVVTAREKLRRLLGTGLRGICFSAEKAGQTSLAENGIADALDFVGLPSPDVYGAALSEFVLAAGVRLAKTRRVELMYLATHDYVQRKWAPGSAQANAFYAAIDRHLAQLDALDWVVAVTADHGTGAKHDPRTGAPKVVYLQDALDAWLDFPRTRVVLPIADPHVAHHGALGSFATIHLPDGLDASEVVMLLRRLDGIALALARDEAAACFELPVDRIGDVVVVARDDTVLGRREREHDLSALTAPLRSHGGFGEQAVPLLFNRRVLVAADAGRRWRNFDVFDLALNHLARGDDFAFEPTRRMPGPLIHAQ
ncbi:phosphonoacetate hydrolase [Burkholderia glumae]|uniref:phosphonoacetate hydrolase n=1 Tax=Burkholderia glumae TaxID=337 RepID=UPI000F5E382D|nr:phosphonoacetate hydrolase [Burkholderia glumae]MCQ0034068.1 phosphonoacetate hydrolase [Burkholderia glumae]MCQ0037817.1 phosphonoacetate hydrolase [Burkholderia glumae]QJW82294.1 phosphonoacetate hydrolase [Burkholderia glumae]RQZ66746.1 phosphonoacetate hydrolase [Burkholderia glumae]UVS86563.1 phosphonoacetate hydrolase [Burkholderia glumae]